MHKLMVAGATWLLAGVSFLALATPVHATTIVDPQIFVQQSGSSPAGGDPNVITNTGAFTVGVAGNFVLQNPLLIIVGTYNSAVQPSISFGGTASEPLATVGTYGLTTNTATLSAGQEALTQLGLSGDGSQSFTNWSLGDTKNGFAAPSSFGLFAFAVPTNLTSGSPITIDESGAPNGSYIITYDCRDGTGSNTGCATNGDIGQTPFTNAGLIDTTSTPIPEPVSIALLGSGLLGLAAIRWRRS